jgi:hypothetical protein
MRNTPENPNEALLLSAVEKLAPLLNRIAFVGSCATGLLVTDPAADPVRRTLDVDAIVAVASYGELISLEDPCVNTVSMNLSRMAPRGADGSITTSYWT